MIDSLLGGHSRKTPDNAWRAAKTGTFQQMCGSLFRPQGNIYLGQSPGSGPVHWLAPPATVLAVIVVVNIRTTQPA
jgi:hypothetical protein